MQDLVSIGSREDDAISINAMSSNTSHLRNRWMVPICKRAANQPPLRDQHHFSLSYMKSSPGHDVLLTQPKPMPSSAHTILQVFQTRLLKSLEEEGPDPDACVSCIRQQTTRLCAAKKVIQGVGHSMGSMVVLQCHLWLTLTEMVDAAKSPLLDAPRDP